MAGNIYHLSEEDLSDPVNIQLIQMSPLSQLFWSENWSPSFYCSLAYEGLISTSISHPEQSINLLMPEMQREYALLDWSNLHVSSQIQRFMKKHEEPLILSVNHNPNRVIKALQDYHDPCWINHDYAEVINQIAQGEYPVKIIAVELFSSSGILLAGELGYQIGAVYTSLSGFCQRTKGQTNWGSLQMILLAKELQQRGFHFWNLGHPHMDYKKRLGARVLSREEFLCRWKESREIRCESPIGEYSMGDKMI
ncbi:MAG: hypothetical protein PF447_06835 [Spirochaetaceae bacterium]|jgi:Leu/Phe-tRNA-protein transferase|nr:hypothetical protein [Spirochaetaceae bacterium]